MRFLVPSATNTWLKKKKKEKKKKVLNNRIVLDITDRWCIKSRYGWMKAAYSIYKSGFASAFFSSSLPFITNLFPSVLIQSIMNGRSGQDRSRVSVLVQKMMPTLFRRNTKLGRGRMREIVVARSWHPLQVLLTIWVSYSNGIKIQ